MTSSGRLTPKHGGDPNSAAPVRPLPSADSNKKYDKRKGSVNAATLRRWKATWILVVDGVGQYPNLEAKLLI